MNIFEEAKSLLDITRVVDGYGLRIHKKKCLCPFHNDKKPSMWVLPKKQIFKCHACGSGGDVIHFVEKYFGITPLDAVKKLNSEYRLNLHIDDDIPDEKVQAYNRKKSERELFKEWEKWAFDTVVNWYKQLKTIIDVEKSGTSKWCKAINEIDYADYMSNVFCVGTDEEKIQLKEAVKKIARV